MTALLTENLPLLAGAPNGIKKVRELILELAVRGKLVQQDPTDEPASELLNRIAKEKALLGAEGKIKKQKPLAGITDQDKPFPLPKGWAWLRLGDLTLTILSGGTPSKNAPEYWGGDIPWASVKDLNVYRDLVTTQDYITEEGLAAGSKLAKKGEVLICTRMGLGKIAIAAMDVAINQDLKALRLTCHLNLDYFLDFYRTLRIVGSGMTVAGIKQDELLGFLVPVPPLTEQHRIVAKVDKLMALCDRLEAQQADAESAHAQLVHAVLDSLTQASDASDFAANWQRLVEHFHTLFTTESSIDALKQTLLQLAVMGKLVPQDPSDEPAKELLKQIADEKARLVAEGKLKKHKPLAEIAETEKSFELPKSWEWVRLEEIAQIGTGATPLRTNPKYFEPAEINWVTSGETSQDHIHETTQKVSPLALTETNLTLYPPHTLVIAMYGQGKTRGQISELLIDACTNQACAAIQLLDQDESHRRYVKYFFVKSYDDIRLLAAGGAQPNLNLGKIKDTVLPLPPAIEQYHIVAKVDQLMAICDQLKARLTQARQLNEQLASTLVKQAVT